MRKLSSYFLAMAAWIGLACISAGLAPTTEAQTVNSTMLRELCLPNAEGRIVCEIIEREFVKSTGAPTERCTINSEGRRVCEWQDAPFERCVVTSGGRQVCNAVPPEESRFSDEDRICTEGPQGVSCVSRNPPSISPESPWSDENMICTEGPQGVACVSRNPPSLPSPTCANVRCEDGGMCIDSPQGPRCLPPVTCAVVRCGDGNKCVDQSTGPVCVPDTPPALSCANVLCSQGNQCVETTTGPRCVPHAQPPNSTPWEDRTCPANYDPVCAQKDGYKRTFGNRCEANRSGYTVLGHGECGSISTPPPPPTPPQVCPTIYQPVCAQKGFQRQTFGNACEASRNNFSLIYQGPCR